VKRECYSLCGLKGQTEETLGIGSCLPPKLLPVITADGGDLRERMRNPRWLIPFSAVGHRCEVGRIRLDEQAILRHESKKIVVRPFVERHDPAERHIPAGVDGEFRQGVRARVAVQNPNDSLSPCLADDRARVVLGVTSMNDHRTVRFSSERNLRGEGGTLRAARGVVVVVVEAALAHRDRAVLKKRAQLWYVAVGFEGGGIVRVDASRRENEAPVFRGALSRDRGGIDGLADADDRGRARIAGAGDYRVAVAGERRVCEVGVAVDKD
jgi:hypothetical protein